MRPELEAIVSEFDSASDRLRRLMAATAGARWAERVGANSWSIAECIAHLNLTSAAFVPLLRDGIDRARRWQGTPSRRYRRDMTGWFIWKVSGPRARFKTKTTPPFVPSAVRPAQAIVAEFDQLQGEQLSCIRDADGLAIDRVKVASPFDPRLHYSVYCALTILPRHQHRHLWQAEQVWARLQH
jgi:hypothetical protein